MAPWRLEGRRGVLWALVLFVLVPLDLRAACPSGPGEPEDLPWLSPIIVRARAVRFRAGEASSPGDRAHLDGLPSAARFAPEEREILERERPLSLREAWGDVELEVLESVKGDLRPGEVFRLFGQVTVFRGTNAGRVPYLRPRPGGQSGCAPRDYRIGAEYLLFLDRRRALLAISAPVNEELRGPDDAWLRWVRGHLRRFFWRHPGPSAPRGA